MRKHRWLVLVAANAGIAFSAAALGAATVTRYSVLFNGLLSGAQTTSVSPDGTIRVDFKYVNNGRGARKRSRTAAQ
jgi:hypothetical protein